MKHLAALYCEGRVVTGISHLEAYEQLSNSEKNGEAISSGFLDQETGEFLADVSTEHFFHKQIILIRHAAAKNDSLDPGLSEQGKQQAFQLAQELQTFNLNTYIAQTSPLLRCLETAHILAQLLHLQFIVNPCLVETSQIQSYKNHSKEFASFTWPTTDDWNFASERTDQFLLRITSILQKLPEQSILISHCGLITNLARIALCDEKVMQFGIPNASVTYIDNQKVKCLKRTT